MQGKRKVQAGTAGAVGIFICLCSAPQTVLAKTQNSLSNDTAITTSDIDSVPIDDAPLRAADQILGIATSPQLTPWQRLTVQSGDTLSGIFDHMGLEPSQWHALLHLGDRVQPLRDLQPGYVLNIRKTPSGELLELRLRLTHVKVLEVSREDGQLRARIARQPTTTREIVASGRIKHSLSASGVPAAVAAQLSRIYHYRHDLRHLQNGDRFSVIYRATYSNDRRIDVGPVLAASITTRHHDYKAFRARLPDGDYGYFDTTGDSYKPAFTRKPVDYTRISSPFSRHRLNPVTHKWEPHWGVDMAAPIGTPIHAAAEGTVKYVGRAGGYGRLVELKNFDGYSTRYAHMHKFRPGLRDGQHVHEGEIIGYVGESGEATGPHLHFEIRIHGVPHNPLTVKLPSGHSLPKSRMAAFTQRIQPLIAKLSPTPSTLLAKSDIDSRAPDAQTLCERPVPFDTNEGFNSLNSPYSNGLRHMLCVARGRQANA